MTHDDVVAALLAHDWRFAKTMPKIPHWYTLRKNWTLGEAQWEAVVQFIRDHGERRRWGPYNHHYLDIGEFKYWTMGDTLPNTILINRAYIDEAKGFEAARALGFKV